MRYVRATTLASAGASLAVALGSCGGGSSPVTSTPPATLAPRPTPTPGTGGGVGASSCPIGRGDPDAACQRGSPRLASAVSGAIDRLVLERPGLFNLHEEAAPGTGTYRVLDRQAFLDGVMQNLRSAGLCAERTLDLDRLLVKETNDSSEEWDVLTSSGFIRRGGSSYVMSCEPASFPLEPKDLIAYVRTALWSFECDGAVQPPPAPEGYLPLACDGRVTATPKLKNGQDVPARIHGTEVRWELREGADVVTLAEDPRFPDPFNRVLHTKGRVAGFYLCATVQGVEGCFHGETIP